MDTFGLNRVGHKSRHFLLGCFKTIVIRLTESSPFQNVLNRITDIRHPGLVDPPCHAQETPHLLEGNRCVPAANGMRTVQTQQVQACWSRPSIGRICKQQPTTIFHSSGILPVSVADTERGITWYHDCYRNPPVQKTTCALQSTTFSLPGCRRVMFWRSQNQGGSSCHQSPVTLRNTWQLHIFKLSSPQ